MPHSLYEHTRGAYLAILILPRVVCDKVTNCHVSTEQSW